MKLSTVFCVILVGFLSVQLGSSCGPGSMTYLLNDKTGFEMVHPEKVDDSLLLNIVKEGARRGLTECQKLFYDHCNSDMCEKLSIFENTTTRLDATTRETAFIHAISSAAITHEVTLQCTQEKIPGCGCSKNRHRDRRWIIGACVDDVEFGVREARRFMDKLENGNDARTAVNLHNNAVGREVVLGSKHKECLYGHHWPKPSSGEKSCRSIACLQALAPFEVVASKLKQKFRDAVQVWFVDNKLQERVNNSFRPVSAEQLVYLDYSPSYRGCVRIKTVRYPGMLGRTSRGDDVNSDKYKSYAAPCSMCKLYPQTVQRREYPWAGSTKYIGPCQLYYQAVQRHLFRRKSGFEMVHPQKVNDSLWFNIVRQGAIRRGYFQCQKLFEDEAWTCPHSMYRTLPMFENTTRLDHYHHYHRLLSPPVNHKASRRPDETTRETAFIYAISAAAITHEVTLQCTQEKIPGCGCSKTRHRLGNWIVSACGDNVKFGMSETRRFLDKLENGNDARTAVNLHNNAVGREVVLRSQQGECLCRDHWSRPGEKFCSVENCPQALAPFEVVASNLKQKYHDAVQVWFVDNKLQERVNNSFTPVSAAQLVFLDSSPDYCVRNDTAGYPGVLGRTSQSNDVNSDKYKSFAALCRTCKLYPQTVQRLEYPRARGCRTLKYVQTTCIADKSEG